MLPAFFKQRRQGFGLLLHIPLCQLSELLVTSYLSNGFIHYRLSGFQFFFNYIILLQSSIERQFKLFLVCLEKLGKPFFLGKFLFFSSYLADQVINRLLFQQDLSINSSLVLRELLLLLKNLVVNVPLHLLIPGKEVKLAFGMDNLRVKLLVQL